MVQRCCVPLCTSKVGDLDIYGIKVRFHRMPHTSEKFMDWCMQITDHRRYKPEPVISSGSRVCSKHFRKEDYLMKKPFGNNPLKPTAQPCIFKWNSACFEDHPNISGGTGTGQEDNEEGGQMDDVEDDNDNDSKSHHKNNISATTLELCNSELRIHREIQCCILDEKLVADEVSRKNSVIEQLLSRISLLEEEQKSMQSKVTELRAANLYYENQIREINLRNQVLEQRAHTKAAAMALASMSTGKTGLSPTNSNNNNHNHISYSHHNNGVNGHYHYNKYNNSNSIIHPSLSSSSSHLASQSLQENHHRLHHHHLSRMEESPPLYKKSRSTNNSLIDANSSELRF